jgi:hypothetical protein
MTLFPLIRPLEAAATNGGHSFFIHFPSDLMAMTCSIPVTAASARLRIITGPDQNHLAHATVYMRLQGVDAK